MTTATATPRRPSRLPHVLAVLYALAVVYASLTPFGPWLAPPAQGSFWLWSGRPYRSTHFDLLVNVAAYVPLGLFVALLPRRAAPARRAVLGTLAGAVLAFAMETAQAWLPTRDASVYDLASNTAGAALGGLGAAWLVRHPGVRARIAAWRTQWFLPGTLGDVGIALMALWLVAQCNPAIGLFAISWDPALAIPGTPPDAPDVALTFVDALESALQFAGMGLFVLLLVRARAGATAIGLLIIAALAGKSVTTLAMLRPAPSASWLRPDVALGIALGAVLLLGLLRLPRAARIVGCAVLLLLSVALPALVADPASVRIPLTLFNWRYGQLLNFNGLTHTVLLVWPLGAAAWLFALAGRPRWGALE
ncbi:MAG: VanZ family protein [Proteobacteria bacterium]|nr:VanZ family protein [Pseudomonadota bacterium]